MASKFFSLAVRPTSRRAGTTDELSGCDRRTVGTGNEAKRERDMREYPFWARGADYIEIMRFAAPRKILRNSPAALPLAQLIVAKKICSALRFTFRQIKPLATTQVERRLAFSPVTFPATASSPSSAASFPKVYYRRRMMSAQIGNTHCILLYADPNFITPDSLASMRITARCITGRNDFIAGN